jgi:glucose-6-phosphate dehydrogenase assembly protein OpcA
MTFTDAGLDELVSLLRCEGTNEPVQAADAITYLRKELRIVSLQYLSDEGQIADRIEAAVEAERERCARVCHRLAGERLSRQMGCGTSTGTGLMHGQVSLALENAAAEIMEGPK